MRVEVIFTFDSWLLDPMLLGSSVCGSFKAMAGGLWLRMERVQVVGCWTEFSGGTSSEERWGHYDGPLLVSYVRYIGHILEEVVVCTILSDLRRRFAYSASLHHLSSALWLQYQLLAVLP